MNQLADLNALSEIAIKLKNGIQQQEIFSAISEIEELRKQNNNLLNEIKELRADGKKTHYERQREIEDELYYRIHGNYGMK